MKNKKLLGVLVASALTASSALFSFTACQTHEYQEKWTYDVENHWHVCIEDGCDEVSGKAAHTWDSGRVSGDSTVYTCTVCEYIKTTPNGGGSNNDDTPTNKPYEPQENEVKYTFEAENGAFVNDWGELSVNAGGGASGEAYVGGINGAWGSTITLKVNATEDTQAYLVVRIAARAETRSLLDDMLAVRVNGALFDDGGEEIKVYGVGDAFNWYNWVDVCVGYVDLTAGVNEFEFKVPTADSTSGNFDCFYLYSESELTEVEKDKNEAVFQAEEAIFAAGSLGLPTVEGDKVGNINGNKDATLTFNVEAPKNMTADLVANVLQRTSEKTFGTDTFKVSVNGTELDLSSVKVPATDTDWTNYTEVSLGEISLVGGKNVIVFTVPSDQDGSSNIDYIKLLSHENITWAKEDIVIDGETQSYTFQAENAELSAGSEGANCPIVEDGWVVGNVNGNKGATITFKLESDKAAQAKLSACINKRGKQKVFEEDTYTVTVNGAAVDLTGILVPAAEVSDWTEYFVLDLALVDLVQGENVIVFTVAGDLWADGSSNMDYIRLSSTAAISWQGQDPVPDAPAHECESVCETCNKCTDAECQEEICLEKCEGHESAHECESVCETCNKCTDAECQEEVCQEKCEGHTPAVVGETYTFQAEEAMLDGPVIEGDKVGNVNGNKGATITYNVTADEATQAKLTVSIHKRGSVTTFNGSEQYIVTVNGTALDLNVTVPAADAADWSEYFELELATIDLIQGNNVIVFEVASIGNVCSNMDYIKLTSEATLTKTEIEQQYSYTLNANQAEASSGLTVGANGAFGGLNGQVGYTITYNFTASKAAEAKLTVSTQARDTDIDFQTKRYSVTLNGETVDLTGVVIPAGTSWVFVEVDLGSVQLKEGKNIITFTGASNDAMTGGDFLYLKIVTSAEIVVIKPAVNYTFTASQATLKYADGTTITPMDNGGVSLNGVQGATITYEIDASAATEVTISVKISQRSSELNFQNDKFTVTVNGVAWDLSGVTLTPGQDWIYVDYTLGNVQLKEGTNVIVFTSVTADGNKGGDFVSMTVASPEVLAITKE